MTQDQVFPTETKGLQSASPPAEVRLADGDHFQLSILPVRKRIGDAEVRMLSYNESIPGPTLIVDQGSTVDVTAANLGHIETTIHWHGLRLDNRSDGVPGATQQAIEVGGQYTCQVHFPDPGIYWYHPHLREDFAQDMGLYGTIVVEPRDASYWPPADRRVTITLDDVLIEEGRIAPFRRSGPTFTAMGRFGNVMLVNGETGFEGHATVGEVLRFHLVNTANTRIFNFALPGARMKLVGGDSGRCEREQFVDGVLLAPSERAIVDVLFDRPGELAVEHRTPDRTYPLGRITVTHGSPAGGAAATAFELLRTDPELAEIRPGLADHLVREPDEVLAIGSEMPILYGEHTAKDSSYVCPMHPEVISHSPERCPKCGMKLVPASAIPPDASVEEHTHGHGDHGGEDHGDGLEWEDLMPAINRQTDTSNMHWSLVDQRTGARNHDISWTFTVGDRVKIRLVNGIDQEHPMHHPFHIHGAGRFLILSRDGEPEPNLVWKDTVLVRAGETVDILLEVTNPGRWMAHCHIAEHAESGMMFNFQVLPGRSVTG